jgi:hypothetical protein
MNTLNSRPKIPALNIYSSEQGQGWLIFLANRRLQPLGHLSGVLFQQFTTELQIACLPIACLACLTLEEC